MSRMRRRAVAGAKERGKRGGSAFEAAAKLLSGRAHGRAELKRKLLARGFDPAASEAALDECARLGFLDDLDFAKSLASELRGRGCGSRKIASTFAKRGLAREVSDEALGRSGQAPPQEELSVAVAALRRKAKSFEREADLRKRSLKAVRFLASRGFPPGVCYEACKRALGPSCGEDCPDDEA